MAGWHDFGRTVILDNDVATWSLALLVFLVTFTILPLLRRALLARRKWLGGRAPGRTHVALDLTLALVERTSAVFLWGVAVWLASRELTFPPRVERWLTIVLVLLFWMQAAIWAMTAVRYALGQRRLRSSAPDTLLQSSMSVLIFSAGLLIWGIAVLLALDNLGVQIRPLLAGLGIGGIAIALAVQSVLSDLLASLSIALDKPFGLGDFLTVDDLQGTVEHIGVKSTRLRSVNGEQIIVANGDILKARVRNFGRLRERRALLKLDVHYETEVAALAAVPAVVREIVEGTPHTRFDRCHLLSAGGPALSFELVYYCTSADYKVYADALQSINLRILERFRAMDVNFLAAMPTPVKIHGIVPLPAAPAGQAG
ncbi:MAG: mechanosensitive ion channel family protein [Gammaproteobacteria bacterium]|nr:mechanosensitive ion channel family protein [Gammaproteobacteria bacterium]MBV9621297.1 mechanosensitive ion channel family protein [Gammaproteobacteria bacterium]